MVFVSETRESVCGSGCAVAEGLAGSWKPALGAALRSLDFRAGHSGKGSDHHGHSTVLSVRSSSALLTLGNPRAY